MALVEGRVETLELPPADHELLPGIRWGRFDQLFTPAFWYSQAWHVENRERIKQYRLGETLQEEVIACLLGGYGMRAELGLAAFQRVKAEGLLNPRVCTEQSVYSVLLKPLELCGRVAHYRYPKQRARFVAGAVKRLDVEDAPKNDLRLRAWLLSFDGIGPKTASWITRNFLDSDNVAIIDIHVFRAGILAGIFSPTDDVSRHYSRLEGRLIDLARAMKLRLSELDTLIWGHMRKLSTPALVNLASMVV